MAIRSKRFVYDKESGKVVEYVSAPSSGPFLGAKGWATGAESIGAGCHPSQVDEFRRDAREAGITGVDFTPGGTAKFSCRTARRDYMKLRGLYDRDAGYGDAAPR